MRVRELLRRDPPYRSIRDYGVVGNESSVALVRIDGSVDWCCLPYLDSPSVFAAILDHERGGFFVVRPTGAVTNFSQRYLDHTNVLMTVLETDHGRLELCDFMPVGGRLLERDDRPAPPELHRKVRCEGRAMEVEAVWMPRPGYARGEAHIEPRGEGFVARCGGTVLGLAGLPNGEVLDAGDGPAVRARFRMEPGEERFLVTRWGDAQPRDAAAESARELRTAIEGWRGWVEKGGEPHGREWAGPWERQVVRSELFLKLMTVPESGALAAAPTMSLPETIGGVRNWDYRYAWIRDAAQIAQAFFAIGHPEQADDFIHWAEDVAEHRRAAGGALQVLHPLHPDTPVEESLLDHLVGYRGSRPVRVGNAAVDQLQLDVYGELLNAVFERVRLSDSFDVEVGGFLSHVADDLCEQWIRPDFGIWEMKNGPTHQVYSKVMAWVGLDRALWLAGEGYMEGDTGRWKRSRSAIADQVLEHGFDRDLGTFVQRYGARDLDAANLLIPVLEFLPYDDPRVQGTIDQTLERLTVDDLVYRYRCDDGLPGEEGAFVLCTLWMADALALSGRLDEAHRIFEGVVGRANHLDLLSEQIDPYSGDFLGNFPQAYSHLGVINSTLYIGAREGRPLPIGPLLGTRPDGEKDG